jgi:hypothetical protein
LVTLFCAPKSKLPYAPKWGDQWFPQDKIGPVLDRSVPFDEFLEYVQNVMDGKEDRARDYPGQNAGKFKSCPGGCKNKSSPDYNRPARTDVEGCCWWGRGVIQTTGVCNFGKLNYYTGKCAKTRTGNAMFGDIDFCKNPQAFNKSICCILFGHTSFR